MAKRDDGRVLRNPSVPVDVPPWMFGGSPDSLRDFCQWEMTAAIDRPGTWQVIQRENVHGDRPKLLSLNLLANAKNVGSDGSFGRVRRLRNADKFMPQGLWRKILALNEEIANEYPHDVAALLYGITQLTVGAPTADELADIFPTLVTERLLPSFPDGSVHLIENDFIISRRYGTPRALLRADDDIESITSDPGGAFRTAAKLAPDTSLGLDAYLSPLFSSLAPRIWGWSVGRAGGIVLYLLGETVTGLRPVPGDALDLLLPSVMIPQPPQPTVESGGYEQATKWWVQELDVVLSNATNPANSLDDGRYSPQRAVERLLTLERYFRHCQVIAANQRDPHSRMLTLFAALDSLPGLVSGLQWTKTTNSTRAREVLAKLEVDVPHSAREVLLPRARAAADALDRLQDGFFMSRWQREGGFLIPNASGQDQVIPRSSAASKWLRVFRNSHHGFDDRLDAGESRLLTMHTGDIAPQLADLAWLFLLDLMAHPEKLNVHPKASRGGRGR